MIRKYFLAALSAALCVTYLSCGGEQGQMIKPINEKIIIIGVPANFEEKWNPFIAENAYDMQVMQQIFTEVCKLNENNELVPHAGNISIQQNSDKTVLYTITLNEGMRFTNGEPVTIDDFIWGLYVRADPSYTGLSPLITFPIDGVESYYYNDKDYAPKIASIEQNAKEHYSSENISLEDFLVYAKATNLDGWWNGDPSGDIGDGKTWSEYAQKEGFGDKLSRIDAASADEMFNLIAEIEWKNYRENYSTHTWFLAKDKKEYALQNLQNDINAVKKISGINKIDDYTCTVLFNKINIYGDRMLSFSLIPKSYYGEITKGDVSKIISNMEPVGSGPYIFQGHSNNIVTCVANKDFFLGTPKIGTVRWQFIPSSETISSLASGAIDIGEVTASHSNIAEMEKLGIRYDLVDMNGFGYVGMNTERVPLYVRKGLWCLFNRAPSVEGYFGNLAKVIERPMTTTLVEYPEDSTQYYPYSKDEALKYFKMAGYSQVNGKLVNKGGKQLMINTYIGASGDGDHPSFAMLVQTAEDMRSIGAEFQIHDVPFNVLQGAMNDGTADSWTMAWGNVNDCDKKEQFGSDGGQNRYKFKDAKMDAMLDTIMETIDLDKRRMLVSQMLDYAMDQCLEFPVYQRKTIFAYNIKNLDTNTIVKAVVPYYTYEEELWKVDLQK